MVMSTEDRLKSIKIEEGLHELYVLSAVGVHRGSIILATRHTLHHWYKSAIIVDRVKVFVEPFFSVMSLRRRCLTCWLRGSSSLMPGSSLASTPSFWKARKASTGICTKASDGIVWPYVLVMLAAAVLSHETTAESTQFGCPIGSPDESSS